MNNLFRLVNPFLDTNMHIFKGAIFIKRAKYESNLVFYASLRIFKMQACAPKKWFDFDFAIIKTTKL